MKRRNRKSSINLSEELGKAINLHQNGQLQQAETLYQKIIRHAPMHPDALQMLGLLYTQTGKLEMAIDLMRKSIKYAPGRPDFLFNLARAYHDKNDFDHAMATYQEYLRLVPDDSDVLHSMGRVLHDKKDLEQAITYYRRALDKSPERFDYFNSLGLSYHAQGDFDQAIKCYEQALKYQPNDFIVLNNLGATFRKLKKIDKAVFCFRQALSVRPDYSNAFNNLGIVLREDGELEEAAENFRKAVAAEPGFAEGHFNLGLVLGSQEMFDDAASSFWRALSVKPGYAEAHYHLGLVLASQQMFDDAASSFRHALSVKPDYAEAHYNLGLVLSAQQIFADAASSFRQALSIKPNYPEALCRLSFALFMQKMFEDAFRNSQLALSLRPECAEAHAVLGSIYAVRGDFDNARASCKKALSINPHEIMALVLLSSIQKGDKDILVQMEKLFLQNDLNDKQKRDLAFSLGEAHADYEKSFFYLSEGNRLERGSYEYSIKEDEHLFGLIKKVYSKHYISKHTNEGNTDNSPIFILGMPRSGTSLVEQILASHPDVYGAGELDDIRKLVVQLTGGNSKAEVFEKIPRSDSEFYELLAAEYLSSLRKYSASAKFITNKLPHNFQFIGSILLALPNAKIIHCERDPMDNCFSIYKNVFVGDHKYAYDLQELGQYYLLYADLMRYWHDVFPGKIYDIKYENIIADQEGETRKLLQHCGLSWNDQCLSFYNTSRDVFTLSLTQVRKPIYKDSIQLWEKFRKHLGPLQSIISDEQ